MKRLLAALTLTLALASCVPAAERGRDLIERSDLATLVYVPLGVAFDPGDRAALNTVLTLNGEIFTVIAPEGTTCELVRADEIDCRLGTVTERIVVHVTGNDIIGVAGFRREGNDVPYLVFLR